MLSVPFLEEHLETDPRLALLMAAASRALHAEDRDLKRAFELCPSPSRDERNQGLGYWVFETTLVYAIFKAWLPLCEVTWEHAYEGSGQKADLSVKDGDATWIFEAKWWPNTQKATMASLHADIEKMRRRQQGRSFLLTFWTSPSSAWDEERKDVVSIGKEGVSLRYVARFNTDVKNTRGKDESYFALALFEDLKR